MPFAPTEGIPITRCRDIGQIAYRSAIALQLAPKLGNSPLNLAREWVACLRGNADFSVSVTPPGWIDCQLTDTGLAQWLQSWTRCPDLTPHAPVPPPAHPFPLQYAHARCCSLLRLAQGEGLIDVYMGDNDVEIVAPDPLPWLDDPKKVEGRGQKAEGIDPEAIRVASPQEIGTSSGVTERETGFPARSLRLQHPSERALMGQLVAIVDALESPEAIDLGKRAIDLSAAFEAFYSQCRILGEVKTRDPALAQARSGLVAVTQTVLKSLLENHFGIPSPMEL